MTTNEWSPAARFVSGPAVNKISAQQRPFVDVQSVSDDGNFEAIDDEQVRKAGVAIDSVGSPCSSS
jgi:hypothetical protein